MVEILRRGERPEERIKIVTCKNCTSELRFRVAEAELVPDDRNGSYYKIDCPVCEQPVTKAVD